MYEGDRAEVARPSVQGSKARAGLNAKTQSDISKPQQIFNCLQNEDDNLYHLLDRLTQILMALSGPFPQDERPIDPETATMGMYDMMLEKHQKNANTLDKIGGMVRDIEATIGINR